MKNLICLFIVLFTVSCTDDAATIRTLESSGFTDIKTTGYSMFACGEDDSFATGFIATNPAGQKVQGTVCCGMFKNCTVRF